MRLIENRNDGYDSTKNVKMSTSITESLMRLVENRNDGYDSSKMLGSKDLYVRSKKLKKQNTVTENYKSLVNRINKLHR